jgi:hypothetical protein
MRRSVSLHSFFFPRHILSLLCVHRYSSMLLIVSVYLDNSRSRVWFRRQPPRGRNERKQFTDRHPVHVRTLGTCSILEPEGHEQSNMFSQVWLYTGPTAYSFACLLFPGTDYQSRSGRSINSLAQGGWNRKEGVREMSGCQSVDSRKEEGIRMD